MLEIVAVEPLANLTVRLTLADGEIVVRDLGDLLRGPLFDPIAGDPARFQEVGVAHGTIAWPGGADIAPETLIWDGPVPRDAATRKPARFLRPRQP